MNISKMRTFKIDYYPDGFDAPLLGVAQIEIHQAVFDAVDDDWRAMFYGLFMDSDIVRHIAYNVIGNSRKLSQLDGFADMPNSHVRVIKWPALDLGMEVKEINI